MMFNFFKNASLFFLGQIFEFISKFLPLKNRVVFNSTNNLNYNFNSKYLFEFFLKKNNKNIFFVINEEELRKKLINDYGNYFISTNNVNGLWKVARSKIWVSSVLETPYLALFFLKNRKRIIYHLGHGIPLKKIGLSEEKMNFLQYINRYLRTRLFTHVLAYSENFLPIMKDVFQNKKIQYIYMGQPRNDCLGHFKRDDVVKDFFEYYSIPKSSTLILYAPTWRSYAKTIFFPFESKSSQNFNDHLEKNNIYIFLRSHPFYPSDVNASYKCMPNIISMDLKRFPEIMDIMPIFDKLITDYSSIYIDYLCLNRPIAFMPYDKQKYIEHVGFSFSYDGKMPGPVINDESSLLDFIRSSDLEFEKIRDLNKEYFNLKDFGNCEDHYNFIMSFFK